jgi:hypothetical protein
VPQVARTFRIFVSSPFRDLKAEREALQRFVFPRLRELCLAKGARFQAIDLRWGVSKEAALDQQTVPICLAEIKRCQEMTPRPNFVVLLGDRYGWQPLPSAIPEEEFRALAVGVDDPLLRGWYRLDENAVPAVCGLRPREGRYEVDEVWEREVERPLREALVRAAAGLELPDEEMWKYVDSATEQEVERGALTVRDADEHVFCFVRTLTSAPGVHLVDDLPADSAPAGDFVDLLPGDGLDREAKGRLDDLKRRLRERLPLFVEYQVPWEDGAIDYSYLGELPESLEECRRLLEAADPPRTLCVDVWRRLAGVILAELERAPGEQLAEAAAHEDFHRGRTPNFVGRAGILAAIEDYVRDPGGVLCAVVGAPGSDKSTLLAKAAEETRALHPEVVVIDRYIGASPGSSDARDLLADLCAAIGTAYGASRDELPTEYRELADTFRTRLALASEERPLILFLDGLDQLSEAHGARSLVWLPAVLPAHARVVVSSRSDMLGPLQGKRPAPRLEPLQRLSRAEGAMSRRSSPRGRAAPRTPGTPARPRHARRAPPRLASVRRVRAREGEAGGRLRRARRCGRLLFNRFEHRGAGQLRQSTGHPVEALALHQFLVARHRESGDRRSLAASLGNQGVDPAPPRRPGRRARAAQGGGADLPRAGGPAGLQASLGEPGVIRRARGDLDGALALLKEWERICRELGNPEGVAIALVNQAALVVGPPQDALPLVVEAARLAEQIRPLLDGVRALSRR